MKALKVIGICSAAFALLCMTGFDCPECNYKAQLIALGASSLTAIVCLLTYKHKQSKED